MKPILIAMAGKSGVGKDTTADHLVSMYAFRKIAFADANRAEVAANWTFDVRWFDAYPFKDTLNEKFCIGNCVDKNFIDWFYKKYFYHYEPKTPRQLQCLWSEYVKSLHGQDYYVEKLLTQIESTMGHCNIVIPDVRSDAEEAAIKELARLFDTTLVEIQSSRGKDVTYYNGLHTWKPNNPDYIVTNEMTIPEFNNRFVRGVSFDNSNFRRLIRAEAHALLADTHIPEN